ncbi:uncharacterized protein LOC111371664 isoform X1 [Olea europaea subsp. europaea]|uniref:Uncharacterized protein LOC111371664 isoform X1 n=1 Tax=Olea europaea subsp. europaea TaxID=158383 RepID=A0A8S0Q8G5_OLEEU|nr:uncharacterized protein LOC111371664 isoform X1 [Olea europaea subsp. europaea]
MEELHDIAKAHYKAGSQHVQALASKFFNSLDSNSDGRIDLGEYLEFTSQKCHSGINSHSFFKKLDKNRNGSLDFWEVMTLYYIMKSGRPFCSFCDNFTPGIFFSCVGVGCSFTLCRDCYLSSKCDHNHNGYAQFLDTYTLLQVRVDSANPTGINQDKPSLGSIHNQKQTYSSYSVHHPNPGPSASTAIVPAHKLVSFFILKLLYALKKKILINWDNLEFFLIISSGQMECSI